MKTQRCRHAIGPGDLHGHGLQPRAQRDRRAGAPGIERRPDPGLRKAAPGPEPTLRQIIGDDARSTLFLEAQLRMGMKILSDEDLFLIFGHGQHDRSLIESHQDALLPKIGLDRLHPRSLPRPEPPNSPVGITKSAVRP